MEASQEAFRFFRFFLLFRNPPCPTSNLNWLAPRCIDRVYVSAYLHGALTNWEGSLIDKLVKRKSMKWTSLLVPACATILYTSCANGGFGFRKEDPLLFSGTIETREIRVGSKVGGRVTEALAVEGQEMKAGQTIIRFDIAGLEAQRLQAEAKV